MYIYNSFTSYNRIALNKAASLRAYAVVLPSSLCFMLHTVIGRTNTPTPRVPNLEGKLVSLICCKVSTISDIFITDNGRTV